MVLPLTSLHQLANLSLDQVPFKRAQMADVELAVQMIGLMQEGASEQVFAGFLIPLSIHVLSADRDLVGTGERFAKLRNAEASLTLLLFAFGMNDLRIGEHQLGVGVFFKGNVDDRQ